MLTYDDEYIGFNCLGLFFIHSDNLLSTLSAILVTQAASKSIMSDHLVTNISPSSPGSFIILLIIQSIINAFNSF